ncbi:MAG: hypothetical protein K9L86_03360 [Candidatus Omnitrophica bacterium]|nr:hypothetical protein [Candidatus Omnitrophota bacterium]
MDRNRARLFELVVLLVVVGILAAAAFFNAFSVVEKAKISKMAVEVKALKTAWYSFYSDCGYFPTENDYKDKGVYSHSEVGPLMKDTDITKDVLSRSSWNGPYYKGKCRSPWLAPYLYDNDNNNVYDPVIGTNPYRGTNIGISELDFNGDVEKIVPAMDEIIDDGNSSTGSLRYTPNKRVFYLIHNNY